MAKRGAPISPDGHPKGAAPDPPEQALRSLFPQPREAKTPRLFRHNFHNKPLSSLARRRLHSAQAVVGALERMVVTLGSVSQCARHFNISRTFLSMVLSGSRTPSRELCQGLGYTPVLMYVRNAPEGSEEGWAEREVADTLAGEPEGE